MKRFYRTGRRAGTVLTVLALLLTLLPARVSADDSETAPTPTVTFTFSDSGISASDSSYDSWVDGTTLTVSSSGTYGVTGSCSDGSIVVKASTTGVKIVMDSLTLSCSGSAPLLCKKASGVTLWLSGTSTLTDMENPDDEDSTDTAVADAFEGAAVKVNKDGASLLIKGSGTLIADGSSCKNAIKAGAESTITISGGTVNMKAANNGLAADGAVIIKGGTIDIDAGNDGIKSSPEDDDTASAGTITIYGGDITIDADSDGINASGDICIYGGTFDITAQSDGIQTDSNLSISNGTFNIQTLNGYNSSSFNSSTMSCKGLKASYSSDDTDDSSSTAATNTISITGGTFELNTADDAIHSDAYVEITGGKFNIYTGDDGVHADTTLILGTENGTVARDPDITVNSSYEGLEAGTVYIYSGRYYVCASDDGINAAGGSTSGTDPGGGGGNNFNPGGGFPGGGGGGRLFSGGMERQSGMTRQMGYSFAQTAPSGQMFPQFGENSAQSGQFPQFGENAPQFGEERAQLFDTGYSLNISGGNVYVNVDGDGLDANGNLTLTGGYIEVWGQSSGDNEPLDYDGTLTVNGATVFAAGCAGMGVASPSNGSQGYTSYGGSSGGGFGGGGFGGGSSSSSGIASGRLISVTNGSSTVYQATAPKSVSYVFFSAPGMSSSNSYSISSGSGTVSCHYGNDWTHSWNSGTVTTAATYTSAGVRTYTCSECGATEAETIPMLAEIPADSDDGGGDDTEDEGYTVTFSTDGHCTVNVFYTQDYTTADETNVTTTVSRSSSTGEPDSSGSGQVNFQIVPTDGYTVQSVTATEGTYTNIKTPSDTGVANVYRMTKITGNTTVTITMTADGGDDTEDEGYTVTFSTDGHCTVNVFYTQDYTTADETNVTTTVSRSSSTGEPDSTGSGQVNFQIVPADGYTVQSVTATEGTYNNMKGPSDTGVENVYRMTKITADTTVTITMTADGGGDDTEDEGYTVTFSTDGHCTVNVFYTQDYTTADETNVTTTVSRSSSTGEPDSTGSGQVNFQIVPADGYTVQSVTATEGTYTNIKTPSDTGVENVYRMTKITADTTVTITMTADGGGNDDDSGNTCAVSGTSAQISLNLSAKSVSAGTYLLIAGFYDADGKCMGVDIDEITVDSSSCATSDMTCPESFEKCTAFVLETSTYKPVCSATELTVNMDT